ncbi:MAG: cadmium-translocating P-type ATPase [Candidatus Bathyarchaeota archaeon]|nr:MAG: cadmium-translocating P-type ATPase [Candidatus Bathyarchaeota archaeon]
MHEEDFKDDLCPVCDSSILEEEVNEKDKRIPLIVLSAVLLLTGLVLEFVLEKQSIALLLFLATAGISGYPIAKEGVSSLLRNRVSIGFLMTIAAVGAFLIGHGEEGASVVFLFYLAEFLEDYAAERARRSIHSLIRLAPETAVVKRDGREERVHVHDVHVDEIILVRPGEKIPLDGVVKGGISSINQASITGESMPIMKQIDDKVYAGTINNEGFLEIRVSTPSNQSMLSRIVEFVEEAQNQKSSTERFVDRFSKYYTPSVIVLAMGVAVIPPVLFGMPFNEWLYRALVLLVVSCPCALAISTPVAMVSAITSAARNGVLIKGSDCIEEMSKIGVFAFDKTGTLTEGKPEVTDVISLGHPREEVLMKTASLEALSEHPIATAIVEKAEREGLKLKSINNFRAVAGKGAICEIGEEGYCVGNRRLFKELAIEVPEDQIEKLENEGKTVVIVGNQKEAIGLIAIMDRVRDTTVETIAELKKRGIRTEMITGDNERTARAISEKIGVDEYHAELLPDEKVAMIREHLATDFGNVAMVGDGVNDAPALAAANIGIAMGAIGSDVSLETADIALMQDDLTKLPYLIELSKKTLEVVKENVLASILIKGSLVLLVFPGIATLWLAVAIGDMGLSLAVILNAMRLSMIQSGSSP